MRFIKGRIVIFAERARRWVPGLVGKRARVMVTQRIPADDVDVMMLEDVSEVWKTGCRLKVNDYQTLTEKDLRGCRVKFLDDGKVLVTPARSAGDKSDG